MGEKRGENKWLQIHKVQHVLKSSWANTMQHTWHRVRSNLDRKHYVISPNEWAVFACAVVAAFSGTCCPTVGRMFSIIKIPNPTMSHSGKYCGKITRAFLYQNFPLPKLCFTKMFLNLRVNR